jgi:hypothetical protein
MQAVLKAKIASLLALCLVSAFATACCGADQNPQSTESVDQQSKSAPTQETTKPSTQPAQTNPSPSSTAQPPAPAGAPAKPPLKPIKLLAEEDYWIDPDRPHIADSSVNVPKGLWLQENGFQQSYANRRSGAFDFPESLIRLGVASRLELRYNTPNFLTSSAQSLNPDLVALTQRFSGFQNMQAGFKARLGPLGPTHFELAVNPYVSIPTGFSGQSQRVDPFIKFPFSQRLTDKWDIEGMQSLFDPTVNGVRNLDWQTSLVLNRSWGRKSNVFIEYVGDVFEHGKMSNLIHFGGAYRPGRRQQIDTQFGFRMNDAAPIAFFGFGYSFLLGNLETPRLTPSHFQHDK